MIWYKHLASSKKAKHGWLAMDTFYTFKLSTKLKLHCTLWKYVREKKNEKIKEKMIKKQPMPVTRATLWQILWQCPARSSRWTHQPVASGARLYGVPSALAALQCDRCNTVSSTMKCTTQFYNKRNYSLTYKRILYWSNIYSRHIRVSYNLQIHLAYNICIYLNVNV